MWEQDPTPSSICRYAKTKKISPQVLKEAIPLRAVSIYKMQVLELLPEPQLPANDCSVSVCPAVITDAAPLPIQEYLNSSLLGAFSIHQPHRRPCSRKQMGRRKRKHQRVWGAQNLGSIGKDESQTSASLKKKKKKKAYMKTMSLI